MQRSPSSQEVPEGSIGLANRGLEEPLVGCPYPGVGQVVTTVTNPGRVGRLTGGKKGGSMPAGRSKTHGGEGSAGTEEGN